MPPASDDPWRSSLTQTLARHDAAISGLSSRMGHVEKTLEGHGGLLHEIRTAVTKNDATTAARPTFNPHQTISTVLALAILFSMVCGGIIYIVNGQNATAAAEQKHLTGRVDKHDQIIERLTAVAGWAARVEAPRK